MKNKFLKIPIIVGVVLANFSLIAQENKKAAKARKDVAEAKEDLRLAKTDSVADYQKFKKEAEADIAENAKKIAELKMKKTDENKDVKEKYDKKVLELEAKNNELKKRIEASGNTQSKMWASFKREFKHDMKALGDAIKDIGVDNAK